MNEFFILSSILTSPAHASLYFIQPAVVRHNFPERNSRAVVCGAAELSDFIAQTRS